MIHIVKRPVFIDLAYGRIGTFLGELPALTPEHTTIVFKQCNRWGKELITDVPTSALYTVKAHHPNIPREGVKILLTTAGGHAPVAEELDLTTGAMYEAIAHAITMKNQAESKSRMLEKKGQRYEEEIVKKATEQTKEMRESAADPFFHGGFNSKRRRPMGDSLIGER